MYVYIRQWSACTSLSDRISATHKSLCLEIFTSAFCLCYVRSSNNQFHNINSGAQTNIINNIPKFLVHCLIDKHLVRRFLRFHILLAISHFTRHLRCTTSPTFIYCDSWVLHYISNVFLKQFPDVPFSQTKQIRLLVLGLMLSRPLLFTPKRFYEDKCLFSLIFVLIKSIPENLDDRGLHRNHLTFM